MNSSEYMNFAEIVVRYAFSSELFNGQVYFIPQIVALVYKVIIRDVWYMRIVITIFM